MTDEKDNVVRIDFRTREVVDDEGHREPIPEPEEPSRPDESGIGGEASKFERFCGMVEHGLVQVTFDTRVPGVEVPESFRGTPQLHLNFSHRFRVDDFEYDERSVRATLSFDAEDFHCVVPWDAVYGLTSQSLDERVVFPESFPAELLALLPTLSETDEDEGELSDEPE